MMINGQGIKKEAADVVCLLSSEDTCPDAEGSVSAFSLLLIKGLVKSSTMETLHPSGGGMRHPWTILEKPAPLYHEPMIDTATGPSGSEILLIEVEDCFKVNHLCLMVKLQQKCQPKHKMRHQFLRGPLVSLNGPSSMMKLESHQATVPIPTHQGLIASLAIRGDTEFTRPAQAIPRTTAPKTKQPLSR